MRRAVVDVGSNSVLLLVAEFRDGHWVSVHETSAVTGLGVGTKETGLLSEKSMEGTLDALGRAFAEASKLGAETITAAATMAARIAANTSEFLERAKRQGTPVSVLSGEEEAELGFRAVADDPSFAGHERVSIIDVGGHSTEIVTADRGHVRLRRSYAIGTLSLRGRTLRDERLGFPELLAASRVIDDEVGLCYLPGQCGAVVALGASATNLITIRERMSEWDAGRVHGAWLGYEEISRAVGWLSRLSDSERAAVIGLEKGRESTIHIGALLLERFLHCLRAEGCWVSVRGWRHALLERDGSLAK